MNDLSRPDSKSMISTLMKTNNVTFISFFYFSFPLGCLMSFWLILLLIFGSCSRYSSQPNQEKEKYYFFAHVGSTKSGRPHHTNGYDPRSRPLYITIQPPLTTIYNHLTSFILASIWIIKYICFLFTRANEEKKTGSCYHSNQRGT